MVTRFKRGGVFIQWRHIRMLVARHFLKIPIIINIITIVWAQAGHNKYIYIHTQIKINIYLFELYSAFICTKILLSNTSPNMHDFTLAI